MAFKIVWSQEARDDLRDIVTFIAEHNRPVAESFGLRLIKKVDLLAQFPHLGRVVPEEEDKNVREVILAPYRIIYCVIEEHNVIAIIRVWHGARGEPDIPTRFGF
jgi:plasmid stabilization system protein ParE